ncbi:hypothetical protein SBOR_9822 [Sclerotinia borealis F-4128]|uniref:Uncharacterized protein n=1 Tax=Sclerotinia borealis (strain F-4128) TaxID=1432307 RepID=W9C291_SCLBF|nr:hypothetical protein SBOR_9822 [Sclerotinia borealis F-4128]
MSLNSNQALAAPPQAMKVSESTPKDPATIPAHPSIKFFSHTLTIELDFAPKIGQEPTDISSIVAILPEYTNIATSVRFSIRDVPPAMNTREDHFKRIEAIKSIILQLNRIREIRHFQAKMLIDTHNFVQMKLMADLHGLVFNKWTLAMVVVGEPIKNVEKDSAIEKRLRGV